MNKVIHYIGLDVHKESIAVSIAPANTTEVRRYGIIGGSLDAVDKLLKRHQRRDGAAGAPDAGGGGPRWRGGSGSRWRGR